MVSSRFYTSHYTYDRTSSINSENNQKSQFKVISPIMPVKDIVLVIEGRQSKAYRGEDAIRQLQHIADEFKKMKRTKANYRLKKMHLMFITKDKAYTIPLYNGGFDSTIEFINDVVNLWNNHNLNIVRVKINWYPYLYRIAELCNLKYLKEFMDKIEFIALTDGERVKWYIPDRSIFTDEFLEKYEEDLDKISPCLEEIAGGKEK